MAHKDSPDLQLPQESERPLVECDDERETTLSPGSRREIGSHPGITGGEIVPCGASCAHTIPVDGTGAQVHELVGESGTLLERRIARFGHVRVDLASMEVSRSSGEPIVLTIQEFKTLKCFLLNPDRVFSRDELLNEAWGYKNYPSTRTVDNHVLRLRQKLEIDPGRPVHLLTIHRVGYKFSP